MVHIYKIEEWEVEEGRGIHRRVPDLVLVPLLYVCVGSPYCLEGLYHSVQWGLYGVTGYIGWVLDHAKRLTQKKHNFCMNKPTWHIKFCVNINLGQEQVNSNNGGHLEPHILVSATELTIVAVSSWLLIYPVDYCCGIHPSDGPLRVCLFLPHPAEVNWSQWDWVGHIIQDGSG